MLQVRGNTLQQVKFKYLGEVFTSDGRENKEIDRWIGKANAALRELIVLWWQNGAFNHGKAYSFHIGLCYDPRLQSWILGIDWKNAIASASAHDQTVTDR